MDITYERTWCDYLTPCPHGNDCKVGDEDCVNNCGYCVGSVIEEPEKEYAPGDYHRYTDITKGQITCLYGIR